MPFENLVLFPIPKKDQPIKLNKIHIDVDEDTGFLVAISRGGGKTPHITFKDKCYPTLHYELMFLKKGSSLVIDIHQTDESMSDPALRYKPLLEMTFTPKPEFEANAAEIGEEFRKRIETLITPLTDDELTSVAYFFDGIQQHKKEVRLKANDLKSAPLSQVQNLSYAGIVDINGHKTAIFIKEGRYHKLDVFDMLKETADLLDRIFSIKLKIGPTVNRSIINTDDFSFTRLIREIPKSALK